MPREIKTGAAMNRGNSFQAYRTPRDFVEAVEGRFGDIDFDLAASPENTLVEGGFYVLDLAPRLSFDGKNSFPKDLCLTVFMCGLTGRGFWRWR